MEQFVVSARKYRPDTFESVVGQEHVTNTLKNAIRNNHLAQAFLFCGPRGVGKTTCARILAKTINCENLKENIEPCNECNSCTTFNRNSSFNIYELDAASNNSVEDIRGLVEQVRYAPQGAKYKIYIIDEVHMLSSAAFNAFLKTLEEPPPYAIFILATTERHKILPTILSRCQIFDFNRITVPDIVTHLQSIAGKESIHAEAEAVHIIAEKADGALRDALSIFDQMVSFSGSNLTYADVIKNLNILDYDYYFRTTDMLYQGNAAEVLMLLDDVLRKGFDAHIFLGGLCDHFRNLLVSKSPQTIVLLEVAETAVHRYKEQATVLSQGFIFNALNIASQYDATYKAARNPRLHVEMALLKLVHLNRAFDLHTAELQSPGSKHPIPPATTEKKTELKEDEKPVQTAPPPPVTAPPVTINTAPKIAAPLPGKLPSLNLKAPIKGETDEPKKTDGPLTAVVGESVETAARLTLEDKHVKKLWLEFAFLKEKDNKMSQATMLRSAKVQLDSEELLVEVFGTHIQDYLTDEKTEIVSYLNSRLEKELKNVQITVSKEEDQTKVLYTPEEKLKAMIEDNQEIIEFARKLGLEIDYS